jgi:hypothetical protein
VLDRTVFKALLPGRWLLAHHQADNLIFGELEVFTQQKIFNVSARANFTDNQRANSTANSG